VKVGQKSQYPNNDPCDHPIIPRSFLGLPHCMFFFYQRQLVMAAIAQMARIAAEESCSAPCLNAGELVSPEETQQVFLCSFHVFSHHISRNGTAYLKHLKPMQCKCNCVRPYSCLSHSSHCSKAGRTFFLESLSGTFTT
jgi:hypothetical protein